MARHHEHQATPGNAVPFSPFIRRFAPARETGDHRLQRQSHMGELNGRGFRTQRIRITVKFLCKEIELAPGRVLARDQGAGLLAMGGKRSSSSRKSAFAASRRSPARCALRTCSCRGRAAPSTAPSCVAQYQGLLRRQRARFAGQAFNIAASRADVGGDEGTRGFRVDAAALADAVRIRQNALRRKPDSRPRASMGSRLEGLVVQEEKCRAER